MSQPGAKRSSLLTAGVVTLVIGMGLTVTLLFLSEGGPDERENPHGMFGQGFVYVLAAFFTAAIALVGLILVLVALAARTTTRTGPAAAHRESRILGVLGAIGMSLLLTSLGRAAAEPELGSTENRAIVVVLAGLGVVASLASLLRVRFAGVAAAVISVVAVVAGFVLLDQNLLYMMGVVLPFGFLLAGVSR